MNGKLHIGILNLRKAVEDKDFLYALAAAVCLKAEYRNSVMYDYSPYQLSKVIHSNFQSAKTAAEYGAKTGMMEITEYERKGKQKKNLRTLKICDKGQTGAVFYYTTNKTGDRVFFFEDKYNKNRSEAESSSGAQSFKSVCDMIIQTIVFHIVRVHSNYVDTYKKASDYDCKERQETESEEQAEETSILNTGISYSRIAELIHSNRAKVVRLVSDMRRKRIVKTRQCSIRIADFDPELEINQIIPDRMEELYLKGKLDWVDSNGNKVYATEHTYHGKCKNQYLHYRPMGLRYKIVSQIIEYKSL